MLLERYQTLAMELARLRRDLLEARDQQLFPAFRAYGRQLEPALGMVEYAALPGRSAARCATACSLSTWRPANCATPCSTT
ncbi:hypothetical protein [Teichococcus aestuarii]|uniref:hypothetical protein n=1 Tax=Teichococcus aestuarii TaxID=568898 RepID=UPI00361F72FE